jgi:hypothetical protein
MLRAMPQDQFLLECLFVSTILPAEIHEVSSTHGLCLTTHVPLDGGTANLLIAGD